MKKVISTVALFCAVTTSNATMIAEGVELVSSKSWVTGNLVNGRMEESSVFFSYASASAIANGGTGRVCTNITSSGNHSFQIYNTTKSSQVYTAKVQLCADGTNCFNNESTYRLNPGASYSNSANTYITSYYKSTGCRSLVASTNISGDVSANDYGNASVCATN